MDTMGQNYYPQIICLVSQAFLTTLATIKIMKNRDQFPVRQLGPISTLAAIYCFFLANIINFIGRLIQQNAQLYDKTNTQAQCRTYCSENKNACYSLYYLGLLFNLVKELPFVIFALKSLRVSICFWRNIYRWIISLFRNQAYLIFVSICYTCLFTLLILLVDSRYFNNDYNYFYYEYFCPRRSSIVQIIISSLRLVMLGFVFLLSIWTYRELDFKRFIFLIFITSNLSYIPRLFLYYRDQKLLETTYHEFYYTSLIVGLLQTVVSTYYATRNEDLNPPPMQGVLQSWQAFHNLNLGMTILQDYAIHRDETTKINYHYRCLESYTFLDQLLKYSRLSPQNFQLKMFLQPLQKILQLNDLVKLKLGPIAISLKKKCRDGTLEIKDVKKIQRILSDFCEMVIFQEWKKTKSYKYLKQQFITNGDINQKMQLFDIPLS